MNLYARIIAFVVLTAAIAYLMYRVVWGDRWRNYGLTNNRKLPWSVDFIEKYKDRLTESWALNETVWEKVIFPNLNFQLVKTILKMNDNDG